MFLKAIWFHKVIWLTLILLLAAMTPVRAEQRLAFVIGNSEYEIGPLANPSNDARLISTTLGSAGFKVTTLLDADLEGMKRGARAFARKVRDAGTGATALFYYAGHGVQVNGRNYLIPVNARLDSAADMEFESMDAQWILDLLEDTGANISIVILDACRNNPFRSLSRSASRGLARMDAPTGSIIAYSTAPGQLAMDGEGNNSPYTQALAQAMQMPGLKVEEVFKTVRQSVVARTGKEQVPWESSSLIGDFYFTGVASGASTITTRHQASVPPGTLFRDCPDCPQMVALPGGSFTIGATGDGPTQQVTVPSFAIAQTETTRASYARFANATGRPMADGCWYFWAVWLHSGERSWKAPGYAQRDDHPVVCMRWSDAQAYADWISQQSGHRYRLPSEAEWEYAAGSAGTADCTAANAYDQSAIAEWGSPLMNTLSCNDGHAGTSSVGTLRPNSNGLSDMFGNGWEWTADCWNSSHAGRPTSATAVQSGDCNQRVYKGGHFASPVEHLRPAFREPGAAELPNVYGTFRLVRDLN